MKATQRAIPWGEILLIWAAGLGAAAQYGKVSVVFDQLGGLYPGVGASVSMTVSLVGLCGIILGTVAGLLAARMGYRRVLILSLWIGAAMGMLQGLTLPFWAFLVSRAVEGASHLGIVVAGPTLIAMLAGSRQRNLAMTIWGTFFGVSFALTSWAAGGIVPRFGVFQFFAAHGAVLGALALALTAFLRRSTAPAHQPLPSVAGWVALHREIYRSPFKMGPAVGWLFYASGFVALLTVLPPHIDPQWREPVMVAIPLVSIASSLTLGVGLTRWMSAVRIVQLGFAASALCTLALGVTGAAPAVCLLLAATLGLIQGASFAAVPQLNNAPAKQAEANGAMAQAGNLGNFIGTPLLVIAISLGGLGGMVAALVLLHLLGLGAHEYLSRRRADAQS
ncbi:MFS transporter [Epibacterium ulvae]|uniref:MFS transporter n=1 Tax=Epibacterium ulvae TaxID=1156985 RepID=UPI001BFC007C|nr:MFS transporter [Epibacterium ulvae]MBT8152503.1 MFS transporter [Epibacterium ulvae]